MTALAAILDEAADLIAFVLAEEEDDDGIADAQWRIDQVRTGNSIRRQGDVYVVDYDDSDNVCQLRDAGHCDDHDTGSPFRCGTNGAGGPSAGPGRAGGPNDDENQDQGER